MARPDRGKTGKTVRKSWPQAALGSLLLALGGALIGRRRTASAAAPPAGPPRTAKASGGGTSKAPGGRKTKAPGGGKPKVRTKPRPAAEPVRTRHWPPAAPKPIAPETEAGWPDRDGSAAPGPASAGAGYEPTDIKAGKVATVVLSSAAVLVLAVTGLFMLVGWVQRGARQGPPLTQEQRAAIVPPAPRLQDHPLHDIAALRQRETDLLDRYAWTDADHRTARIPIARAEALVTGRSLDPAPDPDSAPVRP